MATMQTMSKAPTTPLVTLIVNSLESFTVTVVIPFKIGVTVAGDVESLTVPVQLSSVSWTPSLQLQDVAVRSGKGEQVPGWEFSVHEDPATAIHLPKQTDIDSILR